MKRKQNAPRRIRPIEVADEAKEQPLVENDFVTASDEPEAKRIKSDPEIVTEGTCDDSSKWKWNISDFRKEHSKEQLGHLDYSKEQPNELKERLANDSTKASKESSNSPKEHTCDKERLKEWVNNCTGPSECSKGPVNKSEESEDISKQTGENLKESLLKNPPQVLRSQYEADWKLAARSLKEPSYVDMQSSQPVRNANTSLQEINVSKFRNEVQNDNMPVILNVFSLSKEPPAQQFIANAKQENSVLFTPPCSPPFVQLGAFNAIPISSQHPRYRSDVPNQAAFQQGRENWYKPVQSAHQNFQVYSNKPVQQVYYNYQEYLSKSFQQVTSQEYLNKPAQQVYYTPQEYQVKAVQQGYSPVQPVYNPQVILPKPVQPVNSQIYLDRSVQQVYNPQAMISKPVQQANSYEYQNKPLQHVYPPQEYLSKPVKPVNSQEYSSYPVQQGNPNSYEYLSNPVQDVNPQEYVYNSVQHNPAQPIANGVLPLKHQASNQNLYEAQPNTSQFHPQRYYNYVDKNNESTLQLRSLLSENYSVVERGYNMTGGNGVYARFKLNQATAESNNKASQVNLVSSPVSEIPSTQDGSNVVFSGVQQTAQNQARRATGVLTNTTSTVYTQSGMNTLTHYNNSASVVKYRTEKGCSAILDGFGKNRILQEDPISNNNTYDIKLFGNSFSNPTMISEKQSVYSENSPTSTSIYIPVSKDVSEEVGKGEFVSARDAKVILLKQRLETQQATLEKLRANR